MNLIKKFLGKLIGKKILGQLEKWGVSKTKVLSVLGVLVGVYEALAPVFDWPKAVGLEAKEIIEILFGSAVAWSLRDGVDAQKD